jgi:hypothetical protein
MSAAGPRAVVSVRVYREATIGKLSTAFAADDLDVDEFERRVTAAHRAETLEALDALVADLPPGQGPSQAAPAPSTALAPASDAAPSTGLVVVERGPATRTLVAVMGGNERGGRWAVPRTLRSFTLMGATQLDFREAELQPGENLVRIFSVMGGVDIIVPPEVAVDMDGVAIMGAFEHLDRAPVNRDPAAPFIRITGFVLMGAVDVQTRLPGESARDARRRKKAEAKALRKSAEIRRQLPGK